MNTKQLSIFVGITVALGIGAAVMTQKRAPSDSLDIASSGSNLFLPELKGALNDVEQIVQTKPGNQKLTIKRVGDGWVVAERTNYPASSEQVRKLLITMSQSELIEQKTQNKENYAKLGVNDVTEPAATGVQYNVKDKTGKEVAAFIVGNAGALRRAANEATVYARKINDPQTWLVSGDLRGPTDTTTWLEKSVVAVDTARIQSVEVKKFGVNDVTTLAKTARTDANFAPTTPLPDGKELNSPDAANVVASVVANFEIEDVSPASEIKAPQETNTTTYKTFDGLVLTATTFKIGDKSYAMFAAANDPDLAKKFAEPTPATDKAADKAATPAKIDVAAEVAAINKRVNGWVYHIAGFKYDNLTKTLDTLIKDKAKPEAAAAPSPEMSPDQKLKAELNKAGN